MPKRLISISLLSLILIPFLALRPASASTQVLNCHIKPVYVKVLIMGSYTGLNQLEDWNSFKAKVKAPDTVADCKKVYDALYKDPHTRTSTTTLPATALDIKVKACQNGDTAVFKTAICYVKVLVLPDASDIKSLWTSVTSFFGTKVPFAWVTNFTKGAVNLLHNLTANIPCSDVNHDLGTGTAGIDIPLTTDGHGNAITTQKMNFSLPCNPPKAFASKVRPILVTSLYMMFFFVLYGRYKDFVSGLIGGRSK